MYDDYHALTPLPRIKWGGEQLTESEVLICPPA